MNLFKVKYSQLISLGAHVGNVLNYKENFANNNTVLTKIGKVLCLDIKQTYNELKKSVLILEFISVRKGKVLLSSHPYTNSNIYINLFCKRLKFIHNVSNFFAGCLSNTLRLKYGIPSLAFNPNSDRCWFSTTECVAFSIPVIGLIEFIMKKKYITSLISYKLICNDDNDLLRVFFLFLIKIAFTFGSIKRKRWVKRAFSFYRRKYNLINTFTLNLKISTIGLEPILLSVRNRF